MCSLASDPPFVRSFFSLTLTFCSSADLGLRRHWPTGCRNDPLLSIIGRYRSLRTWYMRWVIRGKGAYRARFVCPNICCYHTHTVYVHVKQSHIFIQCRHEEEEWNIRIRRYCMFVIWRLAFFRGIPQHAAFFDPQAPSRSCSRSQAEIHVAVHRKKGRHHSQAR